MGRDGANGTIIKEKEEEEKNVLFLFLFQSLIFFFFSFFFLIFSKMGVIKKSGIFYLASIISLGILAVIAPP